MSNITEKQRARLLSMRMAVVQCRLCGKEFQDDPLAAWPFCFECVDEVASIEQDHDADLRGQFIWDCAERTNRAERTVARHYRTCRTMVANLKASLNAKS